MTLGLLLMAGRGGKIQTRANIENRISPLAPALPIAYFNNPPIINIQTPCRTIEFFFDFFESFSSATWLKPSTHNGAIVTPYNLGRHNLETLYHQKGKEGSLLSIFRQNTKHFFDKNGSIVL